MCKYTQGNNKSTFWHSHEYKPVPSSINMPHPSYTGKHANQISQLNTKYNIKYKIVAVAVFETYSAGIQK